MKISIKNIFSGKTTIIVISIIGVIFLLQLMFSRPPGNFWFWRFLGRLHPVVIHFPVGLLLFAAVLELFTIKKFGSSLRPGINLVLAAGVISAIFSVIFGLLLSREGGYEKGLINIHKWIGIATMCLGLAAWAVLTRILNKNQLTLVKLYRGILFFSAIGVSLAGHFGGSLTHGKDYLPATIPWSPNYIAGRSGDFDLASLSKDTAQLTKKQVVDLNVEVRAILAHNCYKCHGSEKIKGDLRLDRKDMIFKGGKDGPVLVPGNPDESDLFRRINLPSGHEDAMPSEGKKLSDDDIALLNFWIKKGAPWPEGTEKSLYRVAAMEPRNPPLPPISGNLTNPIDRWTNQYFIKNKIKWPKIIDDRTFLR